MEKLRKLIAEILGIDVSEVTPEKNLKEDLKIDSLKFADIFMGVEESFNVDVDNISEEELLSIQTIADIEKLLEKYSK